MQREFIFTDKWLDLLFENRNRSYGAYVLRKRLPDNIIIGWITAVFFMASVLSAAYVFNKVSTDDLKKIIDKPKLDERLYDPVLMPPAKPESPKNKQQPSQPSPAKVAPVIVDSVEVTDVKEEKKDLITSNNLTDAKDSGDVKTDITTNTGNNPNTGPLKPYDPIEQKPEFPGGEEAMLKFLSKNTQYPPIYLDEKKSGMVHVSFVVDSFGNVTNVSLLRGIEGYPAFSEAAIKSVSKMPKWIPGRQNGKNVSVIFNLPVKFSVKRNF